MEFGLVADGGLGNKNLFVTLGKITMKRSLSGWFAIVALTVTPGINATEECVGLSNILKDAPQDGGVLQAIKTWLTGDKIDCGSLTSVADKWAHRNKGSGKRLKPEDASSIKEAEANLASAYADPSLRARLDKLKQEVADEKTRLFLEAAILDEEGYYAARELRILQLLEKTK